MEEKINFKRVPTLILVGRAFRTGGGGVKWSFPRFERYINPISISGQIMPTILLFAPQDFQTFLRPLSVIAVKCYASMRNIPGVPKYDQYIDFLIHIFRHFSWGPTFEGILSNMQRKNVVFWHFFWCWNWRR